MAEITKITSPLIPKENIGNKYKPTTDQAFELTDPQKIHKSKNDGKILDSRADNPTLRESMGRASIAGLLRNTNDLTAIIDRLALLVEAGESTADIMSDPKVKLLFESLFISPGQIMSALSEQDKSAVLFKGQTFDMLREIAARFVDNPRVSGALANLLKAFEYNVNTENSLRTIFMHCENILDYMFSKDRQQFSNYLSGLSETMQIEGEEESAANPRAGEAAKTNQTGQAGQTGQIDPDIEDDSAGQKAAAPQNQNALSQKEAAQILKGNLLPLLGEIVIKYNQNDRIRDHVMVVVHNIVRVDQGSPDALRAAINKLVNELRQVANLSETFTRDMTQSIFNAARGAKGRENEVLEKLVNIISETLRSETSSPANIRQAETMLMSLLQNQSSMMNVLHFILPVETHDDQMIAELYVDPDSGRPSDHGGAQSRKFFVSFESQNHGAFELSFVQTNDRVDFSMWCPGILVPGLQNMKKYFSNIMQTYGYTMNSFYIDEFKRPHSIADVFPSLLDRRIGIDVRV